MKRFMTGAEVVEELSLRNVRQLYGLRVREGLPHIRLNGKEIRYDREKIIRWAAKRQVRNKF